MEIKKTVAVIIPCYKYSQYLKECLDSVLRQTYPVDEIIVVDDGSPDGEEQQKIVNSYDGKVKIIHKENGGLSSARNVGIKIATSEYIMCLDADDKLVPGAIEEHIKLITDDMTIAQCALMEFGERYVINVPNPKTSLERIMRSNTIFCNAVFPKKAWVEVGGFDESETMRLGYEDWLCWIEMMALGYKVKTSDFIALRYRVHEGQMTQATSRPNRQKLYNYIYNKHKALYEEKGLLIAEIILEK